ncbi:MAG: ligase-associated DNA damage response exonuclease, partial [Planctomycetota bacterium]
VTVSLHPAGHILGSAQVRLEHGGEVCVISGDFKCDATPDGSVVPTEDRTCRAFEPVRCHAFVTESTFGLPVYKWPPQEDVFAELNKWWASNRDAGKASVLFSYSLGKAQRLLAGADASIGPVFCHGAVETCNRGYRDAGVELPETTPVGQKKGARLFAGSLIVAPPSANGTTWMRRFGECSTAFASGWMLVRGQRRRRAVDRGFVLSDHADWDGLLAAIKDSGAEKILVTHGNRDTLVKYLREQDVDAEMLDAWFEGGEEADEVPGTEAADEDGDPVTDGDTSREGDTPQA